MIKTIEEAVKEKGFSKAIIVSTGKTEPIQERLSNCGVKARVYTHERCEKLFARLVGARRTVRNAGGTHGEHEVSDTLAIIVPSEDRYESYWPAVHLMHYVGRKNVQIHGPEYNPELKEILPLGIMEGDPDEGEDQRYRMII